MKNYNDRDARLRGRKLYWHHDGDPRFFPGKETMTKPDGTKNNKVITRLFPLAARLGQTPASLTAAQIAVLRQGFRDKVLAALRARDKKSRNIGAYEQLEPIRALGIMLEYEHRPAPEQGRTMTLRFVKDEPLTQSNLGNNAIVPSPEEVIRNGRP